MRHPQKSRFDPRVAPGPGRDSPGRGGPFKGQSMKASNRHSRAEDPGGDHRLQPLALRPKEAARVLGIGERLLWTLTNQGVVPHVRLGRAIVYPVDELRGWLTERAANGMAKPTSDSGTPDT